MNNDIETFRKLIANEHNPSILANHLSFFISDGLRENSISVYESYLLNLEVIRLRRFEYTQLSGNREVQISTCVSILNQKLLAHVFNEPECADKLNAWATEAFQLNKEIRTHYILDHFESFLDANTSPEFLEQLLTARTQSDALSVDGGPYHFEVFPYHFYCPEKILIENSSDYADKKNVSEEIWSVILDLN